MSWVVEVDSQAAKEFKKLSPDLKKSITDYQTNEVLKSSHPKNLGKSLKYGYIGLWRYRVEKHRIICHIEEEKMVVLVLRIGKRDSIYE